MIKLNSIVICLRTYGKEGENSRQVVTEFELN